MVGKGKAKPVLILVSVLLAFGLLMVLGQREEAHASVGSNPAIGDGNVTVYLFEDYECGHCQAYEASAAYQQFLANWVDSGKVTLVFKHVAFVSDASDDAARSSQCVYKENPHRWLEWDHEIYRVARMGSPTEEALFNSAKTMGLATEAYRSCMADEEPLDAQIQSNYEEFVAAGARGTPSMLIAGSVYSPTDADRVNAAIQEALDGQ